MTVATSASFGMGMHSAKAVRHIVHYSAPRSLDSYANAIGRAGRDGAHARCTLVADSADLSRWTGNNYAGNYESADEKRTYLEGVGKVCEAT